MPGNPSLSGRIKAEFVSRELRIKAQAQEQTQRQKDREARLLHFNKACDDLKEVWGPSLDEFVKQFGDQIKVTPRITPEQRQVAVDFKTNLASVNLSLSASPDSEATMLVLDYALSIIPMFFDYERSSRLEMPLDKLDRDAIGKWLDDRLISCVKAYLSMQDNAYYIQRAMVEDPISKAQFLPQNAAGKIDHNGKIVYFNSQDSLEKYKKIHQINPTRTPTPRP